MQSPSHFVPFRSHGNSYHLNFVSAQITKLSKIENNRIKCDSLKLYAVNFVVETTFPTSFGSWSCTLLVCVCECVWVFARKRNDTSENTENAIGKCIARQMWNVVSDETKHMIEMSGTQFQWDQTLMQLKWKQLINKNKCIHLKHECLWLFCGKCLLEFGAKVFGKSCTWKSGCRVNWIEWKCCGAGHGHRPIASTKNILQNWMQCKWFGINIQAKQNNSC